MKKLKYAEVAEHREKLLLQQEHLCALCGEKIVDDAVLDHCHKTGKIRKVLHRGCNALLGKIENNMPRNKVSMARLERFAMNLYRYIDRQYADILHPTHKTPEEKKECIKRKRKSQRKKEDTNANS